MEFHEDLLPAAVVLDDEGRPVLVRVAEVDGVIVERDTGEPVDLVSTVVVVGLPDLAAA